MNKKLNILILSSYPKSYSGNLGGDLFDALNKAGHNVTYGYDGIEEQYTAVMTYFDSLRKRPLIWRLWSRISRVLFGGAYRNGYYFLVEDEKHPNLPGRLRIDKIQGRYDIIIILFTVRFISASLINQLYERFRCQIFIASIDMYHLTGGCFYFNDCKNYINECRNCPAFDILHKNKAHENFIYKRKIYNETKVTFVCNTWVKQFAEQSKMFDNARIATVSYGLNENIYKPLNRDKCRYDLEISSHYSFIMLTRYDSHPRKGFSYTAQAIKDLTKRMDDVEKNRILLLIVGNVNNECFNAMPIPIRNLGRVSMEQLIKAYNVADVFISSSTDDAGPSMVNQSMACGTPVISFHIGTALDVMFQGISGFSAENKSQQGFSNCLERMYRLSSEEKKQMRKTTRDIALKYNSMKAISDFYEQTYYSNLKRYGNETD